LGMESKIRIGIGYDIHPLVKKRKLIIGGVEIPFKEGLSGWSDADVLTHAIIDALLGAAGLGDRGSHFPPSEPKYKDISSLALLKEVKDKLAAKGWLISQMEQNLSQTLGIKLDQVSVKASTANSMGCVGRGRGIEAQAVALVQGSQDEGI
jgi:2-C-methyl-D-erythritol 2,4-cyclodiphosphate synthase